MLLERINFFWYLFHIFNSRWCQVKHVYWVTETTVTGHWRCRECCNFIWPGFCYCSIEGITTRCP